MRIANHCEFYDASLRLSQDVFKSWFDFGSFCLLTSIDVEPSTVLLAIARFYEMDWVVWALTIGFRVLTALEPLSAFDPQQ